MPERRPPAPSEAAAPEECANCGAAIPRTARSCPACGADERTGWRETSVYDDLDLPTEAFETDRASRRPRPADRNVNGIAWYWWCVGAALLLFLVLGALALLR